MQLLSKWNNGINEILYNNVIFKSQDWSQNQCGHAELGSSGKILHCYFILLLHHFSEEILHFFTPLHVFDSYSYLADFIHKTEPATAQPATLKCWLDINASVIIIQKYNACNNEHFYMRCFCTFYW